MQSTVLCTGTQDKTLWSSMGSKSVEADLYRDYRYCIESDVEVEVEVEYKVNVVTVIS